MRRNGNCKNYNNMKKVKKKSLYNICVLNMCDIEMVIGYDNIEYID